MVCLAPAPRLCCHRVTELEAEKAAVEAAFATYSAEAAARVTSLQHKVQSLQSTVDTQSALGAWVHCLCTPHGNCHSRPAHTAPCGWHPVA